VGSAVVRADLRVGTADVRLTSPYRVVKERDGAPDPFDVVVGKRSCNRSGALTHTSRLTVPTVTIVLRGRCCEIANGTPSARADDQQGNKGPRAQHNHNYVPTPTSPDA